MKNNIKLDIKGLKVFSTSELTTGLALFSLLAVRYAGDKPGLAKLLIMLVGELNEEKQSREKEFSKVVRDFYFNPGDFDKQDKSYI